MQQDSEQLKKTYHGVQAALFAGSCLIVAVYGILFFTHSLDPGRLLGTSPLNLIIAAVHIVYYLTLRKFVNGRSLRLATFVDLMLLSLNMVILIQFTGSFHSPYFALWLLILLAAATLGPKVAVSYAAALTAYFLYEMSMVSADQSAYVAANINHLLVSYATVALGLYVWRATWRTHADGASETKAVNKLSKQLETEQLKSTILLKSIGDGVIVVDINGSVQLINPAAEGLTGWREDEAREIDYRTVMPLALGEALVEGDNDPFLTTLKQKQSVLRNDLTLISRDKKRIMVSLNVSPIFNEQVVSGAIGVFRDISREKAAERQRDEFISTASHEMRTPVAAIEGFLALAMNPKVATVDENAKKYILKAHEATEHLGKLFQDLLSTTKLEDGKLPNHPEPFELGKIIKNTIDEQRFKAENKNLELKLRTSTSNDVQGEGVMPLFYVYADPERIREVLMNLVDNGIKYTPAGEVNVSVHGDDKNITVGIHDQGIGIPEDEVKHLFQKFYRVDNRKTREIGGTGLGLYLARTIIELYNGRIWVESEEGKGSNFYISLPRISYAQAQEMRAKMEEQEGQATAARPQTFAPTISNTVE